MVKEQCQTVRCVVRTLFILMLYTRLIHLPWLTIMIISLHLAILYFFNRMGHKTICTNIPQKLLSNVAQN